MISKKEFCYIFEKLKEYDEKCDKVNDSMEDLFGEYSFIGYDIPHTKIIFSLLGNIFNLEPHDDIIADWYYSDCETEIIQNGVKYKIIDAASMYDYLFSTYKA